MSITTVFHSWFIQIQGSCKLNCLPCWNYKWNMFLFPWNVQKILLFIIFFFFKHTELKFNSSLLRLGGVLGCCWYCARVRSFISWYFLVNLLLSPTFKCWHYLVSSQVWLSNYARCWVCYSNGRAVSKVNTCICFALESIASTLPLYSCFKSFGFSGTHSI